MRIHSIQDLSTIQNSAGGFGRLKVVVVGSYKDNRLAQLDPSFLKQPSSVTINVPYTKKGTRFKSALMKLT
jgi:hypothetical protein